MTAVLIYVTIAIFTSGRKESPDTMATIKICKGKNYLKGKNPPPRDSSMD